MKFSMHKLVFILLLFYCFIFANGQEYTIDVILKNAPENLIYLGSIKGDDYTVIDSTTANDDLVQFKFNAQSNIGVYRINFGYSSEKNKQNDMPRIIDFVFNNENIVLETDFYSPTNTRVIQSSENEIWFYFKNKEAAFKNELVKYEKELNYNWAIDNSEKAIETATKYNQLQMERDLFLSETLKNAGNFYATRLIKTYREPLLDGYLTKKQRNVIFQKEFLNTVDFSDETLIYSQVLTDKIFLYLISYNQSSLTPKKREENYLQAVEYVFSKVDKNKTVFEFIQNYLRYGFELLQMPNIVEYINEKKFAGGE